MKQLISILCSVYNREKYIAETIESVLSQGYNNFELLIVDDGSIDNSVNIIRSYEECDTRIKFWNRGKKGLINQYNFLITQLSEESEFITWIDSDDKYSKDNLSKRINCLIEKPKVALVFNDFGYISDKGYNITNRYENHFPELFGGELLKLEIGDFILKILQQKVDFQISYGNLLLRTNLLLKEGLINPTETEEYFLGDFDIFLRFAHKYYICGIGGKLLQYRIHNEQTTKTREKEMKYYFIKILAYFKDNNLIDNQLLRQIYKQLLKQ